MRVYAFEVLVWCFITFVLYFLLPYSFLIRYLSRTGREVYIEDGLRIAFGFSFIQSLFLFITVSPIVFSALIDPARLALLIYPIAYVVAILYQVFAYYLMPALIIFGALAIRYGFGNIRKQWRLRGLGYFIKYLIIMILVCGLVAPGIALVINIIIKYTAGIPYCFVYIWGFSGKSFNLINEVVSSTYEGVKLLAPTWGDLVGSIIAGLISGKLIIKYILYR